MGLVYYLFSPKLQVQILNFSGTFQGAKNILENFGKEEYEPMWERKGRWAGYHRVIEMEENAGIFGVGKQMEKEGVFEPISI